MCIQMPEAMLEFIRRHRVMVLRQVTAPLFNKMPSGVTVDALLYPWKKLARQIARDLGSSKGRIPSGQATMEAEWRPQTPLAAVVQTGFDE